MELNIIKDNTNQPVQPMMPKQKRQISSWIGFVIILIFTLVAFGGVFAWQYFFVKLPVAVQTSQVQNQTAGWKIYTNTQYGFEIKYPSDYEIYSFESGPVLGGKLIPFQSGSNNANYVFLGKVGLENQELGQALFQLTFSTLEPSAANFSDLRSFETKLKNDYLRQRDPSENIPLPIYSYIKTSLNEDVLVVKSFDLLNMAHTSYYLVKNNTLISITSPNSGSRVLSTEEDVLIKNIVQTFKFAAPVIVGASCDAKFLLPNVGEKYKIGESKKISWKMPAGNTYYTLGIKLINDTGAIVGNIINWNWIKYNPIDSAQWDFKTIYNNDLKIDSFAKLFPGKYKLELQYEYTDGGNGSCASKGIIKSDFFEIIK